MDFNFKPAGQLLAALTITCGMVIAATDAQSFANAGKSTLAEKSPVAVEVAATARTPLAVAADSEYLSAAGEGRFAPDGQLIGGR
jgi:hypothetical protein